MSQSLSPAELNVLAVLNETFPEKVHLHVLAPKTELGANRAQLLRVVDGLLVRGLVDGKPLRGAEGLADVANLLITPAGTTALEVAAGNSAGKSVRAPLKAAQAAVLNVLIASPSDVLAERDAVERAIYEWNASHFARTGTMLHPVRWETHAYPAAGDRPQGLVNKQLVESAHFLIAIFGSRLGSPTGEAESGTLEEIEQFRTTGRHVALYFSDADVARNADRTQLDALKSYREERKRDSLFSTYDGVDDLARRVTQHLPKIVAAVEESMRTGVVTPPAPELNQQRAEAVPPRRKRPSARVMSIEEVGELSPKEIELLWNAAKDPNGDFLYSRTLQGEDIRTNGKHFLVDADARTTAEWLTALRHLEDRGLIEALSEERSFFKVTGEGYAVADELQDFAEWRTSSILLRAYYMNADSREATLECKRVIAIPATYYADQVGADLHVMRSMKARRSLIIEGIAAKPAISWEPTDISFTDSASGRTEDFRVDGMTFQRPSILKLPITG